MIAYHCNANLILVLPFKSKKDTHCLLVYDKIIQILRDHKLTVDQQIIDNEASTDYKRVIKKKWNANYQIFTPNTHRHNAAERAICTFEAHFIAILAGVDTDFQ